MIISFNSTIFQIQDEEVQSILSKILVILIENNHFIDEKSISSIFFNNENKYIFDETNFAKSSLSKIDNQILKDYISKKITQPIPKPHRIYLTHFTIGVNLGVGEVHPRNAYQIITERSQIIVENKINDGKFIRGICQKYTSSKINKQRQSIYLLIDKAIKKGIIEFDHAGGIGEISKITKCWIDDQRYDNIYKYKLMAIFDSDKTHINDFTEKYRKLIEFLKNRPISKPPENNDIKYENNDLIIWHILYKRKIENYIPPCILFNKVKQITETQKHELKNTAKDDLDFIEYDYYNIGIGETIIKKEFPEMFLGDFSYRELEQRCEHHKVFLPEANELVSELEQILLKIAKLI
ncbi:MAG: hypothetical protein LW814_14070 [Anabaena sp. CoA2_C59]|jgi:hypothetical protein|nr:hypothetical protein [Anabaena sp. CoA2_C59]MDJ0504045.1 hypothetical protein [Nostocales cyanobacterium LE14-WE12]